MDRPAVAKTYKLHIGGAFPRSESGRSYPVHGADGRLLAHAARASRKDVRDAVSAARAAFPGWSGATAYNRGQVLYRVAEMLQGRREQFVAQVAAAEDGDAEAAVDAAIEAFVHHAGWTDKIATVLGSVNPVAGPYVSFSTPVPIGVVGVVAPPDSSLAGLAEALAPVLATGCTAVVLAAPRRPLPAVELGEVLATSDVPAGVANLLTGDVAELAPWLASHAEVAGLDLTGAPEPLVPDLEQAAAETVTRVLTGAASGLDRLRAWTDTRTLWHPVGR